jgi:endonuclease/exonuclease/phosphatase family metal-dependent hydrolase
MRHLLLACLMLQGTAPLDTVKVMTFNIRYGTAPDGPDHWVRRRQQVFELVRREDADFIGTQEALKFQLDELTAACPGYAVLGVGRDDGKQRGEFSAILYKYAKFTPQATGTFWLSDTPARPGSMTWGNHYPRLVTWGRFRGQGREFYFYNTHFDHESQPARIKGAKLLMSRLRHPAILTGDLNAAAANDAIREVSSKLLDTVDAPGGTFHAFTGNRTGDRIDYIFAEPGSQVFSSRILHDNQAGRYPSDHFPVVSTFRLFN